MRVLQTIQKSQLRGAEIFACQLSNQLLREGHEVKLLCLFQGESSLPFNGETMRLNASASNRFFDVKAWRLLANEIEKFRPDIVQANAGDTLKYAVFSKFFFRWQTPIIFRNASTISLYIKSPITRWLNAWLISQTKRVISVSEHSKKDFVEVFPFIRQSTCAIPIGLEIKSLPEPIKPTTPFLLHVGGFSFEKNHEGLLDIFRQVQFNQPGLELWLIGDGPLREKVENKVKLMGLEGVKFLGYQQNVMAYMQSAKALLLPSIIEGLPGVILEAMHCKTPVVAYNVGGISEVVENGETGCLVEAGDINGFIKAIKDILSSDHDTLEKIKANAFEIVTSKYDNRKIAERFLRVYQSLHKSE